MFMCERSVLLFNEYINISKTYGNDEINMCDVKQFIINNSKQNLVNKKFLFPPPIVIVVHFIRD